MKRGFTIALCWAAMALRGLADSNPEVAFEAANKYYAENKFPEAAAAYEKLTQAGAVSPALLFNLGNAQFKSGHVGQAVVAYRRAAQMAPRDADLRANLQFARSQVQGATVRPGFLERSSGLLSLNEWAGLSAAGLWLTFGLLAWRQFRPSQAMTLRPPIRAAFVLTLLCAGALAFAYHAQSPGRTVVVISRETPVRITPNDEARPAFTANDGAELRVLDRKDNWLQVTDGSARNYGWVRSDFIVAP